ncbi:DUF1295 domain-containing protein [Gammaproteobacteria bacterium]|nr:DUF1295 domain-containing protein [Gammaproteobacteria bacterium]
MSVLDTFFALIVAALVIGLIGFVRTVWFISLAYTASIAVFVVLIIIIAGSDLTVAMGLQLALTMIWALRLGGFLWNRERNARYTDAVNDMTTRSDALPLAARAGIWLLVAALYVCMFSPQVFLVASGEESITQWLGVVIMSAGLGIEALADHQKSTAKAQFADRFVQSGLFSWVRCPNYFGEMLFWTGNFIAALTVYVAWWQWLIAVSGWISIELIMVGSTRRLELKHEQRYAETSGYQHYVETVPVLLPWLPIYSVRKWPIALG